MKFQIEFLQPDIKSIQDVILKYLFCAFVQARIERKVLGKIPLPSCFLTTQQRFYSVINLIQDGYPNAKI
jgi:hypothetical protein